MLKQASCHRTASRLLAGVLLIGATVTRSSPTGAQAPAPQPAVVGDLQGTWTLRFDNDFVQHTDRCYTGGLSLGWQSGSVDRNGARRIRRLVPGSKHAAQASWALALTQKVYTPDDISITEVQPLDRPYAGLLVATVSGVVVEANRQRVVDMTIGLVGPGAQAEASQALIHRLTPSGEPRGWSNQLQNEPVLAISFSEARRYHVLGRAQGLSVEVLPHLVGSLGNLATFAGAGVELRAGWRLPGDFGQAPVRPSGVRGATASVVSGTHIQLHVSADRKAVARDLLLDGNTFRASHRVKREPFTSDVTVGLSASARRLTLRYEVVMWTRRFATESRRQRYSSLILQLAR